jgi:CarD family transcriptional regulator
VYPAHGVGQILSIEEQEVAGAKLELFVINFIKDKMTLRVPTAKIVTVGMRKLAEAPMVKRALETLKGRARVKRTMWSRRAQEYEAKINSGDIVAIAEVVRDLFRSDTQPEQSYSERQLYEAALDRLSREIAAVQRVTETEAVKEIEAALAKGPRRGPKPGRGRGRGRGRGGVTHWPSLPIFLTGGVLGVPAGVYLLLHLQSDTYRDVMGGLLIAYGGYLLLRRPTRPLRTGPLWDACAGFLGGLTGGLAGFPGAFVTIWCGLKGWDKGRQRGVYQPFILSMQLVTLIVIYLMRPSSTATQLDWKTLAFVPAASLGAWFGLRIFKWLSDRQFELAVNALLILSGVGLIL